MTPSPPESAPGADPARTATDRDPITLYRLHGCPYCERIVVKLDEYDIPYESYFVAGEHSRRNVVARVAGTRAVPVIVDPETGVTMPESANIVEYLETTYGAVEPASEGERVGDEVDSADPIDAGETVEAGEAE